MAPTRTTFGGGVGVGVGVGRDFSLRQKRSCRTFDGTDSRQGRKQSVLRKPLTLVVGHVVVVDDVDVNGVVVAVVGQVVVFDDDDDVILVNEVVVAVVVPFIKKKKAQVVDFLRRS